MRIKITAELPVPQEIRPEIGQVFEVSHTTGGDKLMHFIVIRTSPNTFASVGVTASECEAVE